MASQPGKNVARCRKNGNPEALYRKGLICYFQKNCKLKGLGYLAKAAEKGNKKAKYVYGLILICLGGKTKQKGLEILSSLTTEKLVELRYKIRETRDKFWDRGNPVMEGLKTTYVREKCECDGKAITFLARNCGWHAHGENNLMDTSSACDSCLWHHEVELFYKRI